MSQTINFPDLDDATREYLLQVREHEGRGSPGVFAPVSSSLAGCGCILGPIITISVVAYTLFSDVLLKDPTKVAMLQTAAIMLGGWLVIAAFRIWSGKNSPKRAGNWVYGDPQFLYEANGEEVKITPVDDVLEAQFTHNYNNGAYQNSVVKLRTPSNAIVSAQVNHEQRAEQMVVFYNYLAWARGPEGGDRAELEPAVLGGLAKYVAKNDNEPLDAAGNINLNMIELDIGEIPAEPRREGGAGMNPLPYVLLLVAGVATFFVMRSVINIPMRDDRIFKLVTTTTTPLEPHMLRKYLNDTRNKKHRDDITKRLSALYDPLVQHVSTKAQDPSLRAGMLEVIEEVRKPAPPYVSIRVTEAVSPPGGDSGKAERVESVRKYIVEQAGEQFKPLYGQLRPTEPGATFVPPEPPPVGLQVMEFVEADEKSNPHFDITYQFEPGSGGQYKVRYTVTIRTKIEAEGVASKTFALTQQYTAADASSAATALGRQVVADMIGFANAQAAQ
jgi:hypothetical protein